MNHSLCCTQPGCVRLSIQERVGTQILQRYSAEISTSRRCALPLTASSSVFLPLIFYESHVTTHAIAYYLLTNKFFKSQICSLLLCVEFCLLIHRVIENCCLRPRTTRIYCGLASSKKREYLWDAEFFFI